MTAEKPVFLLGLGAQKAGTTWLHDHLSGHPSANFGMMKEYHIFDALYVEDMRYFLDRRDVTPSSSPRQFLSILRRTGRRPQTLEALRARLRAGADSYSGYFRDLVNAVSECHLTGDMTPEYGCLPRDVFAEIRSHLEAAGFTVRPVFLLRDPVARCISAARMYIGREANRLNAKTYAQIGLCTAMDVHPFTPHAEIRTRYDRTLTEVEAVFQQDEFFVGFYEELFSDAEIRRLSHFLGIPHVSPDFGKEVNASSTPKTKIDPALRARIATHYRPVYEDMFRRFGEERIRRLWPSAVLLD
ncbi:MAG: sulfotransferase [Maritimibacter sp.]|uniref:sulfotransferase n=1 Tax=Maritimibacter sp. TaxID=2003363 RepID=UPI001D79629C|nr:sulfotransferase [Maritimibacter sp.]MBL6427637.1 sulfotransferase [Maritimibacter sp.]